MRALCLLLAAVSALSAGYPGRRPYEVEHYDVSLRPDPNTQSIEGTVRIRLHSISSRLGSVMLDASGLDVISVQENGAAAKFDLDDDLLAVVLAKPAEENEVRTLEVKYRGKPKRGMRFYPDHVYTVFATSSWLVCNDRPDNRATYRLELTVPASYTVVASGKNVSESEASGWKKSVWEQGQPIPSFVFGFAAGQFQSKTASPQLAYFSTKHTPRELESIFSSTQSILKFFEQKSGVPLPSERYSQVLVSGGAEQEAAAFTMLPVEYGTDLLQSKGDLWLMAHELAHQWWGIAITCRDWSDFWLNEGVASYMADAFLESYTGKSSYEAQIQSARSRYEKAVKEGKDRPLLFTAWREPSEAGGSIPYAKGAYFLHVLRQRMGDEAFWSGLKKYTQANLGRSVETKNFQAAMEAAAGKPLTDLFDQFAYARTLSSK